MTEPKFKDPNFMDNVWSAVHAGYDGLALDAHNEDDARLAESAGLVSIAYGDVEDENGEPDLGLIAMPRGENPLDA